MTDHHRPEDEPVTHNGPVAPEPPNDIPDTVDGGESTGKKQASPELKRFWEAVKHLPAYVKLAAAIVRDPDVPNSAKVVLGMGGGYAISPIDLVPGIIPVAGQMDDLYAMLTALRQSLKRMPDDVARRHLDAAGVTREQIEDDLTSIRDLAKLAVVKSLKFGGKALGRFSRAAIKFANDQLQRRDTGRGETAV